MAKLDNVPAPGPWNDLDYNNIPVGFDFNAQYEREEAALLALQEKSDALADGEVVGGLLSWGRGDGSAFYLLPYHQCAAADSPVDTLSGSLAGGVRPDPRSQTGRYTADAAGH